MPRERLTQFAVVLATRDDWTTRDQVVALLWPDLRDDAARRNLRKLLFRARRQAAGSVEMTAPGPAMP